MESCPVCKLTAVDRYHEKNGFLILRCKSCGLAYVQDPFPQEELAKFYHTSYLAYHPLYGNFDEKAEQRYSLVTNAVGGPTGTLLDVGCSYGFFLNVARIHGWAVKGVEVGQIPSRHARTTYGLDVFQGALDQAHFSDSSFNVVTMFHVIEHAQDPLDLLSEVGRVLKRGGSFILLTPNIESLHSQLLGKAWTWLHPPDHLFYFSRRSLGLALHKTGFRIESLRSITVDADNLLVQLSSLLVRTKATSKTEVAFRWPKLFRLARVLTNQALLPERLLTSRMGREDEIFAVATKI